MFLVDNVIKFCLSNSNKKVYLVIDGKKIPMKANYYVADDIFFFEIDTNNKKIINTNEVSKIFEDECKGDIECWGGDIYVAPMDKIGNCEIRFVKDFEDVYNDIFNTGYEIENIKVDDENFCLNLKKY